MAFLERASMNIKEFLSLGGPVSLERGLFLKPIRSGISIKKWDPLQFVCVCVGGAIY